MTRPCAASVVRFWSGLRITPPTPKVRSGEKVDEVVLGRLGVCIRPRAAQNGSLTKGERKQPFGAGSDGRPLDTGTARGPLIHAHATCILIDNTYIKPPCREIKRGVKKGSILYAKYRTGEDHYDYSCRLQRYMVRRHGSPSWEIIIRRLRDTQTQATKGRRDDR